MYKTASGVSLDVLAAVVWSQDTSCHVCPHGTTRLTLDGFSLNFKSEYFLKIRRENPSFIKI